MKNLFKALIDFIKGLFKKEEPIVSEPSVESGETITVTGLIVGRDLISTLKGIPCDEILLCDTMLRDRTDRFLDDMTLGQVAEELGKPLRVVRNNGESLIRALWGMEENDV